MDKSKNCRTGAAVLGSVVMALCTPACSTSQTFAVINNTDATLRVEYTLKADAGAVEQLQKLAAVAADRASEADAPWEALATSGYSYDQAARRVVVQVPPATAVRVAALDNYVETDAGAGRRFPIATLTMDGPRGRIYYEGEQLRMNFQNRKGGLYEIAYE